MKNYFTKSALAALASLALLASCDKENETPITIDPVENPTVAYVLNTGNWGGNDGSIQGYIKVANNAGQISTDLFAAANGHGIGEPQDLCVYGRKIYIPCSTQAKIEVVEHPSFRSVKQLPLTNEEGQPISPRYATAVGGKVYFTTQRGTVLRIDTLSLEIDATLPLGGMPEALTHAGGKLYINLSDYAWDYSGKEVAVVDIATFTVTKRIEVVVNPYDTMLTGSDGMVYFVSVGHYDGNPPATLQRINPATDEVTTLCNASKIALHDHLIYILYAEANAGGIAPSCTVYDVKTGQQRPFINYNDIPNPAFLKVDPKTGDVYIGSGSYGALFDVYVYGSDGVFKEQFEAGVNTTNLFFVE
ncbi:MAG: hypothetical protein LBM06_01625 [Prevotellaceae bacterium]|jgi:hypothetical protein|nr:hypothetical protein [Prevotellaceae bacterium]